MYLGTMYQSARRAPDSDHLIRGNSPWPFDFGNEYNEMITFHAFMTRTFNNSFVGTRNQTQGLTRHIPGLKLFIVYVLSLCLGPHWQYSEVIPNFVLRDYSQWSLGDHMGYQGSNSVQPHARQTTLPIVLLFWPYKTLDYLYFGATSGNARGYLWLCGQESAGGVQEDCVVLKIERSELN